MNQVLHAFAKKSTVRQEKISSESLETVNRFSLPPRKFVFINIS